ncbi:MAG: caspase family protein, partial [Cyclobacteriaceae bacterium]
MSSKSSKLLKSIIFRLLILIILLTVWSGFVQAQTPEINGKWQGTYTFMGKSFPFAMELTGDVSDISGVVYSMDEDPAEYYKYTIAGSLRNNKLILTGQEFTRKAPTKCMAKFQLQVIEVGNQIVLNGKWGANLKIGGCLPGAAGKVSLYKAIERRDNVVAVRSASSDKADEGTDIYTTELINGLKKRSFHALIIGVDSYDDATVVSLDNTIKDGTALSKVLTDYYSFEKENVTLLKNPDREAILNEFERLSANLTEQDNLLVFYAGHGFWDEKLSQGYWLPSDAKLISKSQWISNATIRDYIRGINTQHTLLIADACFSGGLLKSRGVGKAMSNLYNMPSRKAITSGTLTTVPDQSVFIKYLLKYLENNDERLISADQIFYQIKISVINNSPNSQVPQYG